jgi:choline dehydrogenase-like flavoprotein
VATCDRSCCKRFTAFPTDRDKRAVGVEFTDDPVSCPDADQSSSIVRASKLVVVSGGAFGSPAILERSGIGAEDVLKRCGIEQLVNLPGVGENYRGTLLSNQSMDLTNVGQITMSLMCLTWLPTSLLPQALTTQMQTAMNNVTTAASHWVNHS